MTVEAVKDELWKKSGTTIDFMRLELNDDTSLEISDLDERFRPLGFYSPNKG
jgi:tubulin-specific chaperone B